MHNKLFIHSFYACVTSLNGLQRMKSVTLRAPANEISHIPCRYALYEVNILNFENMSRASFLSSDFYFVCTSYLGNAFSAQSSGISKNVIPHSRLMIHLTVLQCRAEQDISQDRSSNDHAIYHFESTSLGLWVISLGQILDAICDASALADDTPTSAEDLRLPKG